MRTTEEELAREKAVAQANAAEFSEEIYHLTAAQLNLAEILSRTSSTKGQQSLIAMMQEIHRRLTVLLS